MKENKKRIIFWFIVMVVFLILFFSGRSAFKNGYGRYGTMKKILDPIALEFNTLEDVTRLTDIRADVSKDALVVTYITASNKKEKYKFEYKNENGIEYITNKDEYGSQTWNFIANEMSNAVYHINGGKGSIFALYEPKSFNNTTLSDGLIIDEISKTVSINLKTNVVKNIFGKIPSLKDDVYAKETDLQDLANKIKINGFFLYENQDVKIYIKPSANSYEIYSALTDENAPRVFKSIANIVKVLKPDVYKTLNITDENNITFESSTQYYQTQVNVLFSEANIFKSTDSVYEFLLFK